MCAELVARVATRFSDIIVHRLLAVAIGADASYADLLDKKKTQVPDVTTGRHKDGGGETQETGGQGGWTGRTGGRKDGRTGGRRDGDGKQGDGGRHKRGRGDVTMCHTM